MNFSSLSFNYYYLLRYQFEERIRKKRENLPSKNENNSDFDREAARVEPREVVFLLVLLLDVFSTIPSILLTTNK